MSEEENLKFPKALSSSELLYLKTTEMDEEEEDQFVVKLHPDDMKKVGLNPGDIIELEGSFRTAGFVFPERSDSLQSGTIKLSLPMLNNCQEEYGDIIKARNPKVFDAKNVTMAPYKLNLNVNRKFPRLIRRTLEGYPVTLYDLIKISKDISKEIEFVITSIEPNEVCVIGRSTKIKIDTSLTTQIRFL